MPRGILILSLAAALAACEGEPSTPMPSSTGESFSLRSVPYSVVSELGSAPADTLWLGQQIRFEGGLQVIENGPNWRGRLVAGEAGHWRIDMTKGAPGTRGTLQFEFRARRGGILRLGTIPRGNKPELSGLAVHLNPGEWTAVEFGLDDAELPAGNIRRWTLHPPAGEVELRRVFTLGPGLVHPASIRLDRRRQDAWLLSNDSALEWAVELPDTATLQMSFAQAGSASLRGDGVGFYVQRVDGNGGARTLWTRHLLPHANPSDSGWQDASVPLSPGRFRLRIGTRSSPERSAPFHTVENAQGDQPAIGTLRLRVNGDHRPNVLVMVVDTLRDDAFDTRRMPKLAARAEEYIEFSRAYSTGAWTHPSTGSLLTGLMPYSHGLGTVSGGLSFFRPGARLLAERYRDGGYRTYSISHNHIVGPLEGFARGVDEFDETVRGDPTVHGAERLSRAAWEWLERNGDGGPFFAYLHYFDPHDRYAPPAEFAARFVQEDEDGEIPDDVRKGIVNSVMRRLIDEGVEPSPKVVERLRALYDGEAAYVDHWIDWLLTRAEAQEWFDDTIVVFTSDHGEEFAEHGNFKHGHTLYDEQLAVPLAIRPRGAGAGRRLDGAEVSGIDVAPTLLEMCGLPMDDMPGHSLVDWIGGADAPDRPVYFSLTGNDGSGAHAPFSTKEGGLWDGDKYILAADATDVVHFDLRSDPGELSPAAVPDSPQAARILTQLRESLDAALGDSSLVADDPQALERLRALGYVD